MMPLYQRAFFEAMLNAVNALSAALRRMLEEDKRLRTMSETSTQQVDAGGIDISNH